jgi:hypothetical protein
MSSQNMCANWTKLSMGSNKHQEHDIQGSAAN